MASTYSNTPKLKAAGLWQKTSAAGNTYFVGRLGGVRILIFENRERTGEDEPSHLLFFADGGTRANENTRLGTSTTISRSRPRRVPARRYDAGLYAELDDPVGDLWPER
jgi:hypothetical protein